jgi:hypothetical protein
LTPHGAGKLSGDGLPRGAAGQKKGSAQPPFFPRHGVRVKHEGKTADFVICFQFNNVRVYVDGGFEQELLVSDAPAATFSKTRLNELGKGTLSHSVPGRRPDGTHWRQFALVRRARRP